MKGLLIGGTGPTGPYIVGGLLKRGYDVSILHRGAHEVDLPKEVEHIHADPHFADTLAEGLSNRKFDVIICSYGRLRHVAEVVKERTPRFIGIGGGGYMGAMNAEENPDGTLIPRPRDMPPFSQSKMGAQIIATQDAVMEAHKKGYYEATILHYPLWVFGPRCLGPREWSIIKRILDGRKHIIIPDGGLVLHSRGYAENLAHAVLLAVDKAEAIGEVYNAADDYLYSLREWILRIADAMEYSVELVSLPWDIAKPSYPYTETNYHNVFDTAKIKLQLGYKDVVSADTAIQRTIEWNLNNREYADELAKVGIGDKFDYETEDKIINEYRKSMDKISQIPFVYERPPHPYPHPRERFQSSSK